MKFVVLCMLVCLPGLTARAQLTFQTGMTAGERQSALEVLGYGSAFKILDDPYPLGGYSGVEIGLDRQTIPTANLPVHSGQVRSQAETSYVGLELGKGLYDNVDMFVQFAPGHQAEQISSFGGAIRWGFFEAQYLPISLSAQIAANSTDFQNMVSVSTQTLDLIASFAVQNVTLYVGGGTIRAAGSFMGGASGITDSGEGESETVSTGRFMTGLVLKFQPIFLAIEGDHATDTSYGLRLGCRF